MADFIDPDRFKSKVMIILQLKNEYLEKILHDDPLTVEAIMEEYEPLMDRLRPFVKDSSVWLNKSLDQGMKLLCEGAQGTHLDVDHGTYPFVTSSNSSAGGALTGLGVGPRRFHHVLGVVKAYITRVGHGPFPTEDFGADGEQLRRVGHEYGSTTGRPRRCGWFDVPVLKYSARINGLTTMAITKLDVLSGFEKIKICTGYRVDGMVIEDFPEDADMLARCQPEYITVDGWQDDISGISEVNQLPATARSYLKLLEELTDVEIGMISLGPEREKTVINPEAEFIKEIPALHNE